ncbi:hypothetical protein ACHAWF_011443 [Thalassiosira exigua]
MPKRKARPSRKLEPPEGKAPIATATEAPPRRPRRTRKRRWFHPSRAVAVAASSLILPQGHRHRADAISANPNPVANPAFDGTSLGAPPIYLRGDETYHWYEDERGYTLVDDPDFRSDGVNRTTRKVYARTDPASGALVGTGVELGAPEATIGTLGLTKHLKPSPDEQKAACGRYCDDDPSGNRRVRGTSSRPGRRARDSEASKERSNRRRLLSSSSALKNLVLLIRFSDHVDRTLPDPADFDVLLNGPGGPGTVAPTGSVNDVFLANSYGKFRLASTVYPAWIPLSGTEAYYADDRSGLGPRIFEAIREALEYVDSDPDFDVSEFNVDYELGDPYVDAVALFHSGYGAEFGGYDCDGTSERDRIWSHSWLMYDGAWTSRDGKVTVRDYHVNPGLWDVCGSEIARIGVVAHETSHFLGLPDLYDPDGGNGIGVYCLMSDSWGVDGSQLYPPMMSAWSKIELGWLTPTTLEAKGDFALRQSWQHPDAYRVELLGRGSDEYLLIENRQPGSFDRLLTLGGLAIWHVDDSMSFFGNAREGHPGQSRWPANGDHYRVALLQADGRYDLERGYNRGDYADLFRSDYYFGVDHLFPSRYSDPLLGPFPNTDSYQRGVVARTNHFISGISATGPEMTFSFLPSSPCRTDEIYFDLTLVTDGKGHEASWTLSELHSGDVALSGGGYGSYAQTSVSECVPARCYAFEIRDSGNDGLCCDFGVGGFGVRLNGLKVASGNTYGSRFQADLRCMIPPTAAPTEAPTRPTGAPSMAPSASPSTEPTFAPTGYCGMGNGLVEIIVEGEEFIDEIVWNVEDIFGNVVLSNDSHNTSDGSLFAVRECLPLNSCYTFSIHDPLGTEPAEDNAHRGVYTVKVDDRVLASGSNFRKDQTTMFGVVCVQNGDAACTEPDETSLPMSMFRLELAADEGRDVTWNLVNGSKQTVRSSGPFGNCNINTLAMCLPRDDCYEFTITDDSGDGACCSYAKGLYTVMFSQVDDMIQNHTGPISDEDRVYLGSCYGMNFD